MMAEEQREAIVMAITQGQGIETTAYTVALEIKRLIAPIIDEGRNVDSGCGFGGADLWAWIGGREFLIHVRPSKL